MSAPARPGGAKRNARAARSAAAGASTRRAFESQAEILKLARLLHREPESLAYLEQLPLDDLRALREQTTDVLFSAEQTTLVRLAGASKLLPAGINAAIAQHAFGPLLSARVTGLLDPSRAVDVAEKLPPAFLADVAIELDPRRASDVIARIPPEQIAAVTVELLVREEHVTMGRFVGHLAPDAIRAALVVMDDRDLLRIGFVLEDKDRLNDLVDVLAPVRLEGLIEAAHEGDLWPEALDLLSHLDQNRQRALAEVAIGKGDAVLDSLVLAAETHAMWDAVLQMESTISEESRDRFVGFVEERRLELLPRPDSGSSRRP